MKLKNNFPALFQIYKDNSGKTQAQIAEEWGVDPATLSRHINGFSKSINYDFFEAICIGLKITPGDLFVLDEE